RLRPVAAAPPVHAARLPETVTVTGAAAQFDHARPALLTASACLASAATARRRHDRRHLVQRVAAGAVWGGGDVGRGRAAGRGGGGGRGVGGGVVRLEGAVARSEAGGGWAARVGLALGAARIAGVEDVHVGEIRVEPRAPVAVEGVVADEEVAGIGGYRDGS